MSAIARFSLASLALCTAMAAGQMHSPEGTASVHLHLDTPHHAKSHDMPAVLWLKPLPGTATGTFAAHGPYTLLQKNRTFLPHLQVVPVNSVVRFPNADPFFHNVFSLFDGKRFDLGLYEAGSRKQVTFSREGVSYIFCNIHPEMSAVIVSLSTPFFAVPDARQDLWIEKIPPGDYEIDAWIEGVAPSAITSLHRQVHLTSGKLDLGSVTVDEKGLSTTHLNKFGKPYDPVTKPRY